MCPLLAAVTLLLAAPAVGGDHWPHWRGPTMDGLSAETGLPTSWGSGEDGDENVLWRLDLPGWAASSPVVWGDQIFLTSTEKGKEALWLLAVGRDGKEQWRRSMNAGKIEVFEQFAHETNAAAPSPVTDGEHVYALFGTGQLAAFDLKGNKAWEVLLGERYGAPNMFFGLATSPLIVGDQLVLQLLHTDAQLVVALDKSTGKELWKHERSTDATGECLHAYTSVVPFRDGDGDVESLLVHGADYITAHRATDGHELWRYGTLNPKDNYNSFFRLVASPVSADGLVIAPTAKRGPVFGLRPGAAQGGAQRVELAWKLDAGTPDVPSPILADGLVYLAGENGRLTVLDASTGEKVYAERVHQGPHRGSPVHADGKLYLTAADGTVSVVQTGREFKVLSKNHLDAGRLAASPAISGKTIFIRTAEALFALAATEKAGAEKAGAEKPAAAEGATGD
ncbi:MAG: PQQ-binding-like beta-propeller repeat protein [Acidobacteriota bacterium]